MKFRTLVFSLLFALGLSAALFSRGAAQQGNPPPSDDEINAVAKQLYCPVCENIPLDVCPTQACAQWRDLIKQKLMEGWSEQQIKDYFVRQYGDRVLAEPPRRGLNWLVYIIPPAFILIGLYILVRVLRGMRRPAAAGSQPPQPPAPDSPDAEYLARLEEELKKRK